MRFFSYLAFALIACTTVCLAEFPEQKEFKESLTSALKSGDREAFYKLVCFDGCDKNWVQNNKMAFEELFKEAAKNPKFTASISGGSANLGAPLPTQRYNLPVAATYLMNLVPGLTMNCPLGLKEGKLQVVCVVLKDEEPK